MQGKQNKTKQHLLACRVEFKLGKSLDQVSLFYRDPSSAVSRFATRTVAGVVTAVGSRVEVNVGSTVGPEIGTAVSTGVGVAVGTSVGRLVRTTVGTARKSASEAKHATTSSITASTKLPVASPFSFRCNHRYGHLVMPRLLHRDQAGWQKRPFRFCLLNRPDRFATRL